MSLWRAIYIAVAAAILAYFAGLYVGGFGLEPLEPIPAGVVFVLFAYLVIAAAARDAKIWNAVRGEDGRASTSRFQIMLWTVVVVFSYVAILTARWRATGLATPLPDIPENVLLALGISAGTATAAAAVTASNTSAGKEVKVPATNKGLAPIFQTDDGQYDLAKIQLVTWTFLAMAVFLGLVLQAVRSATPSESLPDIDPTLMVLTGLGSATYLGKKLVPSTAPFMTSISTPSLSLSGSDANRTVTLVGGNFGATQGTGRVSIDDVVLTSPVSTWSETTITFVVPPQPTTGAWRLDTPLDVRVLTPKGPSANTMPLTVTA